MFNNHYGNDIMWGYINTKNEFIINPEFWGAECFVNGKAKVMTSLLTTKTIPGGWVGFPRRYYPPSVEVIPPEFKIISNPLQK
jgi:hypothetical protein